MKTTYHNPIRQNARNRERLASAAMCAMIALSACGKPSTAVTLPSGVAPDGVLTPSALNEAHMAIDRGLDWLAAHQQPDGSWSDGSFPALTALPLWAFLRGDHPDKEKVVSNAVAYILSCRQDDGGIYRTIEGRKGGGLSNYNTAICITALNDVGDPSLIPVILKARKFLSESQYFGDDHFHGGMGYDAPTKRAYTDLLNTYYAAEAMRLTQHLEDVRPEAEGRADLDWKAAAAFASRLQNRAGGGPDHAGGFVYNPVDPKAGASTNADGVVTFRSYGSITYAGMMTLLYAEVAPNDARVKSAVSWATRHWTLEENPGLGQLGIYFFYNIMAKCLSAYGIDSIHTPAGRIDWRKDIVNKLIELQVHEADTGHAYWVNPQGKYMEGDKILTTAYSLLVLEIAAHQSGGDDD